MKQIAHQLFTTGIRSSLWVLRRLDRITLGGRRRSQEEYRQSPYESYAAMRARGHVVRSYATQGWMVNGAEEVQQALRSDALSNDVRHNWFFYRLLRVASKSEDIPLVDKPAMLGRDPPDHSRLRKLVTAGFTQSYIASLTPMIESLVDQLLDEVAGNDEIDVIASIAKPLPAMVIAEMMGVPVADRHLFQRWSEELTGALMIDQPELIHRAALADRAMRNYLAELVRDKEKLPGQDFISRLLAAELEEDRLTRDELISNCILLLTAGHETTTRLIGNGLYTLIRHADQMELLRNQPELMPNAIEEMLRYESPIQITLRFVARTHEFMGNRFRRNQMVMIGLGSANRDPVLNQNPDRFDIQRTEVRHVAFGYGIHLCLGLMLARIEARIALRKLLDRYPTITLLDEQADWGSNPFFRGLNSLRVAVS